MENKESNNDNNAKKDQARNLFFETGFTQAQIAELLDLSQKTISVWMNEGKWKMLKETAEHAPSMLIEQMVHELTEMHTNIASREPGKRFATVQEAEIRRKTMMSMKYVQQQHTTAVHAEVMANFLLYARKQKDVDIKALTLLADKYIKGEKKLELDEPFKYYSLPGQFHMPPPAGTQPPPTPNNENNPGSLAA